MMLLQKCPSFIRREPKRFVEIQKHQVDGTFGQCRVYFLNSIRPNPLLTPT